MADSSTFREMTGEGVSPSTIRAQGPEGRAPETHTTRKWFWPNPLGEDAATPGFQASDLQQILQSVLGTTAYAVNTSKPGGLNRTLPLADPTYPWLYASNISSITGLGGQQQQVAAQLTTNGATFPGWTLFPSYEVTVECSDRPYPVSPDSSILAQQVSWYDISNTKQTITYYPEWLRFCDWDLIPMENWLNQQRGAGYYQTLSQNEPGFNAQQQTQQNVRMLMPDQTLRLYWVGVPARYVLSTNSYLNKFRGLINQNDWNGPLGPVLTNPRSPSNTAGTVGAFPMGSLLYVGYKPTKYSPNYPVTTTVFGSFIDYSKLMNIELIFISTTRTGSDLPTAGASNNCVIGGHNLQPYLPQRKFYYVFNQDLAGNQNPSWYSFPIELLFSDPDAPTAYKGTG